MVEAIGDIIIAVVMKVGALITLVIILRLVIPKIRKLSMEINEAYRRRWEDFRLELTPEERKRFDAFYRIRFSSYDAKRKEEE
ncbi:MAG: hypothetical protein QXF52_07315 [Thermoproteota archaeon]